MNSPLVLILLYLFSHHSCKFFKNSVEITNRLEYSINFFFPELNNPRIIFNKQLIMLTPLLVNCISRRFNLFPIKKLRRFFFASFEFYIEFYSNSLKSKIHYFKTVSTNFSCNRLAVFETFLSSDTFGYLDNSQCCESVWPQYQ